MSASSITETEGDRCLAGEVTRLRRWEAGNGIAMLLSNEFSESLDRDTIDFEESPRPDLSEPEKLGDGRPWPLKRLVVPTVRFPWEDLSECMGHNFLDDFLFSFSGCFSLLDAPARCFLLCILQVFASCVQPLYKHTPDPENSLMPGLLPLPLPL